MLNHSRKSPHLLIFIHSLRGGGAERVVADMSAWWADWGIKVTVVTQTDRETDVYSLDPRVGRHVLGTAGDSGGGIRGLWANLRRLVRLRRILRREQPTVVLGMMTTASILAVMAAWRLDCRVIATEHAHPPSQRLPQIWQRLRRWAYPRAHRVVALTDGTARWIGKEAPGAQLAVIPNAVRWPLQDGDPVVEPPVNEGRCRLLAVGRLHPVKGFDRLIAAFSMIADRFPDWDLVILGEGDSRQDLERQVRDLHLDERVSLPGRVGNISRWYETSDLYVLSSRMEGLSNTLLEAMASGLAAVAVDCDTGPREIIRDGIDGVLVNPADDEEALAAYMSDLMAHPEKRQALARRAVDVRDRFSMPRIMTLWGKLFG
ncbi:MAG TPA: glycosyltransferase family 4 protein [Burkholderiaceae bacterium]|nr:glycosyltransferase family 4 protein [Burkholderiaceae bacterium]